MNERTIEELKSRRCWGKLTVSKTYHFKAGEIYQITEGTATEESKKPKNGKENHGDD